MVCRISQLRIPLLPFALGLLLSATVSSNVAPLKNLTYSPIGNILSKSDLGTYAAPGAPLPHAVTSISGSTLSTTFTYDPNGNQLTGLGRNITWTSYNMPASITQGTNTIQFQHDVDHQRVIQIAPDGTTTIYINAFGVSTELFAAGTSAARWTDYLSVGNAKVGMRIVNIAAATVSTRYFHTDHLGSVSVITDENGVVVERLSYDAWGKRRFASGADDPTGSITSQSPRGFTGEEQLDTVALVHLNGRVYDPLVGRMISADPTVPDPLNAQAWNRYSYVGNDPLAFTDPSGFSWLSGFFHSVGHSLGRVISSIGHFISQNWRSIAQIAINFALNAVGLNFVAAAALSAAIVNGLSGGNLGQVLRAGAIAGATTLAFAGLNVVAPAQAFGANFDPVAYAENVGGSALVGCASSAASGGSCGSGAAAGAVSAGLSPVTRGLFPNAANDLGQRIGGTIVQATAGGLASVAGGGKFANGAVTGAFQYLVTASLEVGRQDMSTGNARSLMDALDQAPGSGLTGSGLTRIQVDPGNPFAATPEFLQSFLGSPEEQQVADTIKGASSGALPARETIFGDTLGLPGGSRMGYYIWSLGPTDDPGAGRIANVPGSLNYYYSPGHYFPTPTVPNAWVQFVYPVMGSSKP